MSLARDLWTDERLDDLNHRVDGGFVETHDEFDALRADMRSMRHKLIGLIGTMVIGFAGTIATILAHG